MSRSVRGKRIKQLASVIFAVIVMSASVFAQTWQQDELNTAVREATDYLNGKVPKGNQIVILNVKSGSDGISDYIINKLIENAVNDGFFTVVDRQQIEEIQSEQQFQMSGAVNDKDALAIGQFFGAQTIVSGAVNTIGKLYNLSIRALDVQTAQVQAQFNKNIASSEIMNSITQQQTQGQSGQVAQGQAQPAQQIIIVQQPGQQTIQVKPPKPPKPRKHDWYFAPKYQLPVNTPVSWGAINLEGGLFWESGMFFGLDLDAGYGNEVDSVVGILRYDRTGMLFGAGLSIGKTINLFEQAQLVYGCSFGFWMVLEEGQAMGNWYDYDFLAPLIKLRWNFVEISYRHLIGYKDSHGDSKSGIGLHTSQLMIGVYFKTSKMGMSR